jgi:uncharacterized Fe-S cluster-containing radical SAM superfamily protein
VSHSAVDVVLLSPPFFRVCGSHNDRAPLSLAYLSRYLDEAGIDHVVINADYTGANRYWSMRWMFDNFQSFINAVDGVSSLYGEVVEQVMSYDPTAVVILGGEPLIATKDWTNPFIAANYARLFRALGVHTIGFGHFFSLDAGRFVDQFDTLLRGEPSRTIVDVVRRLPRGVVDGLPIDLDVSPLFAHMDPPGTETDFVMTSFGCRFPCAFCLVQQFYSRLDRRVRYVEINTVVRDIAARQADHIYFTDLTFSHAPKRRLRELIDAFAAGDVKRTYTIDTRVDCLDEEKVELLAELGVTRVKIGVEGITPALLASVDKRTTPDQIDKAVARLQRAGMEVLTYLLIGGPASREDYEATKTYIRRIAPDFVPVAIWAYKDLTKDYRYDTQFSPWTLANWGIDKQIFYDYIDLQQAVNPTVGAMLDINTV